MNVVPNKSISFLLFLSWVFITGVFSCKPKKESLRHHETQTNTTIVKTYISVPGSKSTRNWSVIENGNTIFDETFSYELIEDSFSIRIKPFIYNGKKRIPLTTGQLDKCKIFMRTASYDDSNMPNSLDSLVEYGEYKSPFFVLSKRVFQSSSDQKLPASIIIQYNQQRIVLFKPDVDAPKVYHVDLVIEAFKLDRKFETQIRGAVSDFKFLGGQPDNIDPKLDLYVGGESFESSVVSHYSFDSEIGPHTFSFQLLKSDTIGLALEDHDGIMDDHICGWKGTFEEFNRKKMTLPYAEKFSYTYKIY